MSEQALEVEDIGAVRVLRITRPHAVNAINGQVLFEMIDAVKAIDRSRDVRCFVITGGPRADGRPCFSAGDDLKEAAEGGHPPGNPGFTLTNLIDDSLVPSIAVVDGICTTGALEIAMACDLRIVANTARISDWHLARLGTGLGGWGTARGSRASWASLRRRTSSSRARRSTVSRPTASASPSASCGRPSSGNGRWRWRRRSPA